MKKQIQTIIVGLLAMAGMGTAEAQDVEFCGVKNTMRYDDGDDTKYEYVGWNAETGKAEFSGDVGLWKLNLKGSDLQSSLVHYDNLMYGNSGSVYINGVIYTIFSHEDPEADQSQQMEFIVRKWNASTYELISEERFPKSADLESRGMTFNPKDGKVYGLFYLTGEQLPVDEEELDQEDREEGYTTDAGYALCTIDLNTMALTQITPGLYYENFVTLACSPSGRLLSMTSGGTMVEFDPATGLMMTKTVLDADGEPMQVSLFEHSGVESQFKRQAACFDHNTGKMYWNGYINSGKGINEWGSWSNLSDREWRTNGKYDTALYEVDVNTGKATMIAKVPNRIAFSCLWVVGADGTTTDIDQVNAQADEYATVFDLCGRVVYRGTDASVLLPHGTYVVKRANETKKVSL